MSFLVRRVRESRWEGEDPASLPAESLLDLEANDNTLSFWLTSEDLANIDDIVVAIAATRNAVANVDVALIKEAIVEQTDMTVRHEAGDTPFAKARRLHRSLPRLTAQDVLRLAVELKTEDQFFHFSRSQVTNRLLAAIAVNDLNAGSLKPDVRAHIEKRGPV